MNRERERKRKPGLAEDLLEIGRRCAAHMALMKSADHGTIIVRRRTRAASITFMFIDTSAVLAIQLNEPDAPAFTRHRSCGPPFHVGGKLSGAALVIDNRGDAIASREFD